MRAQSDDARIEILLDEPIGTIAPEIYGHFVEHLGGRPDMHVFHHVIQRIRPLGWEPGTRFADGMRATVDWYRANEAWWRKRKSPEFWDYYRKNYKGLPANALPTI